MKLLVLINQSFSGYLIYFYYDFSSRAMEANMYEIKSRKPWNSGPGTVITELVL